MIIMVYKGIITINKMTSELTSTKKAKSQGQLPPPLAPPLITPYVAGLVYLKQINIGLLWKEVWI